MPAFWLLMIVGAAAIWFGCPKIWDYIADSMENFINSFKDEDEDDEFYFYEEDEDE